MKKFLYILLLSFTVTFLCAAPRPGVSGDNKDHARPMITRPCRPRDRLLRPSSTKRLEDERICELSIQTNVSSAEVYINGHYEGRTSLIVKGLRPGVYSVEIRKSGYEREFFVVELRPGFRNFYSISLEKIIGKIDFHGVPSSAKTYVDGSLKTGSIIEIEPGYHLIEVKRFGYKTYSEKVNVEAYEYTDVYPEFVEAPFEITSYNLLRDKINPDYNNVFGKTEFSFSVTANGSAEIEVLNQNEEVVWSHNWNSFSTWNHSITFSGRRNNGEALPDGLYIVKISSGSYSDERVLTLDRSVSYSLMGINTKGSGIGSMPVVFNNGISLVIPYFQAGYILNESVKDNFLDFKFGVLCDFVNHIELNLAFGALPGGGIEENKQMQFNTSVKIFDTVTAGNATFCYGGLIHCSFVSERMPLPVGIDNGNGLGFAAMAGLDSPLFYVGLSSDYILAADTGKSFRDGSVWKNGIAASIKVEKFINVGGWLAVDSSVNNPNLSPYYNTELLRAVDYGGELLFTFGSSSVMGNVKVQRVKVFSGTDFINLNFGLSYLL